jgi:short-subunit dehydrogenase
MEQNMSSPKPLAAITGASSGIGAVYARRFAERGYDLLLIARRADRLADLAGELKQAHGITVETLAADLTDPSDLERVAATLRDGPNLEILVNNAGNGPFATSLQLSDEQAANTLALNVTALMTLSRAVLPGLTARGKGGIINIGSVLAFHSLPATSLYSATKAFVLTYSRALGYEVGDQGVHVQAVLPAGTTTEFYEVAGVPIASFDPKVFMTAEQLVDAALAGFDKREAVTLPSVHDENLWLTYDEARANLFAGTQNGSPAPRYL